MSCSWRRSAIAQAATVQRQRLALVARCGQQRHPQRGSFRTPIPHRPWPSPPSRRERKLRRRGDRPSWLPGGPGTSRRSPSTPDSGGARSRSSRLVERAFLCRRCHFAWHTDRHRPFAPGERPPQLQPHCRHHGQSDIRKGARMDDLEAPRVPYLSDDRLLARQQHLVAEIGAGRRRRQRRGLAFGGVGLTAAGVTAALVIVLGAGTPSAFAAWTPSPTTPAPGEAAAAESACKAGAATPLAGGPATPAMSPSPIPADPLPWCCSGRTPPAAEP